jgi:hypothetical protein
VSFWSRPTTAKLVSLHLRLRISFGIEKFLGELLFQHINSLIQAKVTAKNVLPGDKAVGKH